MRTPPNGRCSPSRQVFDLAERVGRRPDRQHPQCRRLLGSASPDGRCDSPEVYARLGCAALWQHGRRWSCRLQPRSGFHALVLLATFASLRWGEDGSTRSDIDLKAALSGRAAYAAVNRRDSLGPPKSQPSASRRHSQLRSSRLCAHLPSSWAEPGALVFSGPRGANYAGATSTRCRGGPHAAVVVGMPELALPRPSPYR